MTTEGLILAGLGFAIPIAGVLYANWLQHRLRRDEPMRRSPGE